MKLRKIMTGIVASSLALSTLAVAASASSLKKVTEADGKSAGLSSGTIHGSFRFSTKAMKLRTSPLQSMISTTQR